MDKINLTKEILELEEKIKKMELEISVLEETKEIKGIIVFKYIRCGRAYCKCMQPNGIPHGPYPHLQWHENGKLKTKYLNKKIYENTAQELEKAKKKKALDKTLKKATAKKRSLEKKLEKILE